MRSVQDTISSTYNTCKYVILSEKVTESQVYKFTQPTDYNSNKSNTGYRFNTVDLDEPRSEPGEGDRYQNRHSCYTSSDRNQHKSGILCHRPTTDYKDN
ncbi:hypothetical protein HanIR_Chr17g0900361 [Helianthus annuus]|nr:hypothetical protein HanIR_Chr17g0900361 [Helianthus annuus]